MAICEPKNGIQLLLKHEDYQREVEVAVELTWDIVKNDESGTVLMPNVYGHKGVVTRVAQEAFGFDTGCPLSCGWKLVSSKTKMQAVTAIRILEDLGIDLERIMDDIERKKREDEKKK